jgi:hypothetical protein
MELPGKVEIADLTCFSGYVDPTRVSLGFLYWVMGCRPMGSPMFRPFCKEL